ncbi:MAG: CBS domain-containing protein [Actinomycetota bacterium]|nr:CBS domain-containing protein [Actinomycetota bacterium]
MTRLGDVMARDPVTVAPEDTLGEAAAKMNERGIGSAIVLDFGRMIGILTERDIMRAVAYRTHSSEARVREWMTAEPVTATPSTSVDEAARIMLENGFRHLPVVEGDRAVGVVSLRDLARSRIEAETMDA